jgi:hypothetical protein
MTDSYVQISSEQNYVLCTLASTSDQPTCLLNVNDCAYSMIDAMEEIRRRGEERSIYFIK